MDTKMLIGSRFEKGTETEEPILNPKTGEIVLRLPEASQAQREAAVAAASRCSRLASAPAARPCGAGGC